MLRMRNSCLASASSTWCPTSVCVAVLFGAKTKSWTRHPHSGRICRSPSAVPMMMRTDSSMLASYRLSWMAPFGPTEKGDLKPTPRKLLIETPDARAGYAAAIATSTTRLQLGQVTMVRPCRSSTWSPSGALHSGQRSPLVRPALTASMISHQTDSSAVRRSSAFSSMSAKAPSFDAPGASQPRLNCEETCSRKADPYLARWGAIKPPPGRSTTVDLDVNVNGDGDGDVAVAALMPRLRRGRRAALRNFPPRAAGRGRSRLVGEEEEEQSDDQHHRCQGPDAERDPHSPAAARPRQLGALVVAGPCVEHGFLGFVQLGLGRALRHLGLLRRHDVRRRRFAGGRPSWGGAEELGLARRLGRWDLLGR